MLNNIKFTNHANSLYMYGEWSFSEPDDPFADLDEVRKKRQAVSDTTAYPNNLTYISNSSDFIPTKSNFSVIFITTGCRTWNEENKTWAMEGCEVNNYLDDLTGIEVYTCIWC